MCIHTAGHRKLMDSTNVQYCTCARYNCTLEYCNRNSELELSCATEYLHGTFCIRRRIFWRAETPSRVLSTRYAIVPGTPPDSGVGVLVHTSRVQEYSYCRAPLSSRKK